jgi:hypothetical protein
MHLSRHRKISPFLGSICGQVMAALGRKSTALRLTDATLALQLNLDAAIDIA